MQIILIQYCLNQTVYFCDFSGGGGPDLIPPLDPRMNFHKATKEMFMDARKMIFEETIAHLVSS